MSDKKQAGYGIILGALIGTMMFIFYNKPYLIAIGAALGLVLESILKTQEPKVNRDGYNH